MKILNESLLDEINRQYNEISFVFDNEQKRAILFLRKKMGLIRYFLWKILNVFPFGVELSYGFGKDGYIEKAKEMGFRDHINFTVNEIMEDS